MNHYKTKWLFSTQIKLKTALEWTDSVQQIDLSAPTHTFNGTGVIVGWGSTETPTMFDNKLSDNLRYGTVHSTLFEKCREIEANDEKHDFVIDDMICAEHINASTCRADSGGPLIVKIDERLIQIGITSWSTKNCSSSLISGYTNVTLFLDWIENIVYPLSKNKTFP